MPGYPEIRLAFATPRKVARMIREHEPDYIHIATEGPVGLATRAACLREGRRFTTAYHTRFPEYVSSRLPVPESIVYGLLRRFHRASARVLVATATLEQDLRARGFDACRCGRAASTPNCSGRDPLATASLRGRCFSMSAVSRWRKTSMPFFA
jgi:hypothetical protein